MSDESRPEAALVIPGGDAPKVARGRLLSRQCAVHKIKPSADFCDRCGLIRRRQAAARLVPLANGRRDPLNRVPKDGAA